MKTQVKSHSRKTKKGKKCSIRSHGRKTAAWKKQHPRYKKWGVRANSCHSMQDLLSQRKVLLDEKQKMESGHYDWIQAGHAQFIARRLRANTRAIQQKKSGGKASTKSRTPGAEFKRRKG